MDEGLLDDLETHAAADDAEHAEDSSRTTAVVVVAAVVAIGVGIWLGRSDGARHADDARPDALARLAAAARQDRPSSSRGPERPGAVTFPGKLSDAPRPTTALAAVRAPVAKDAHPPTDDDAVAPPPAIDRLAVVPLPARDVLLPSPTLARPADELERQVGAAARGTLQATPGSAEGYQLQVSSFTAPDEAHAFAERLRERGHRAFVATFVHADRGTFYRVRLGPFPTAKLATEYRARFEAQEHMAPYLVLPEAKPH